MTTNDDGFQNLAKNKDCVCVCERINKYDQDNLCPIISLLLLLKSCGVKIKNKYF